MRKILDDIPSQIGAKNNDGWMPLHQAAFSGNLAVVKLLVERGADLSAGCKDKDTPLHYAAAQGHCRIIRFLASKGADLRVKDRDGESPVDVIPKKEKDAKRLMEALLNGEDCPEVGSEEDEWETDESESSK